MANKKYPTVRTSCILALLVASVSIGFGGCKPKEGGNKGSAQQSGATIAQANAALEAKKYTDALAAFEAILATNPNDMDALFGKAYSYQMLGSVDAAVAGYKKAAELANSLVFRANYNLGSMYVFAKNFNEAAPRLRLAVQAAPENFEAQYNLGFALEGVGQDAEALKAFEAASRILPKNAPAAFNLGRVQEKLGKKSDAKASYKRALEADPNLAPAQEALSKLK